MRGVRDEKAIHQEAFMSDRNQPTFAAKSSEEKKQGLKKRLKQYALRIIRLYEALPKTGAVHVALRYFTGSALPLSLSR